MISCILHIHTKKVWPRFHVNPGQLFSAVCFWDSISVLIFSFYFIISAFHLLIRLSISSLGNLGFMAYSCLSFSTAT